LKLAQSNNTVKQKDSKNQDLLGNDKTHKNKYPILQKGILFLTMSVNFILQ